MGDKRKEKLAKFHREMIMAAAKKLFEEKGIELTTVDEIAKEADYSKSTLYVYFKSKEEIKNHIIYEQMAVLKDILLTCIQREERIEECFYLICKELSAYQERHPLYYELMLHEIKFTQEDIDEKNILADVYRVGEENNDMIKSLLEKGIKSGYLKSDIQIFPTALYLWSGISETIRFANEKQEYLKFRMGMEKEEYMQYCFNLILKSIRRDG